MELEAFVRDQFFLRRSGNHQVEAAVLFQHDLELDGARGLVSPGELLEELGGDSLRSAREAGLGLVQGHDGRAHIALGIGDEVHRPLSVDLVVGCVKAVGVEAGQGELDLVEVELELSVFHPDLQDSVSGLLILAHVIREGLEPALRLLTGGRR